MRPRGCDPKVFAERSPRISSARTSGPPLNTKTIRTPSSRACTGKVTTPEDAFVAAFDEPEPQAAFEPEAETADPEPAYEEPAYREPAYHAPDYTPVAAAEETPADVWAAPPADDEPIVEPTVHGRPIFHEVFSASEPEPELEQVFESAPLMADEARTAADVAGTEDLPAHGMALDEYAATISHSDAEEVETVAPLAAAAPEPVEPADEITDIDRHRVRGHAGQLQRANLPSSRRFTPSSGWPSPSTRRTTTIWGRRVRGRGRRSRHRLVHRAGRRRSRGKRRTIRNPRRY